MLTSCFCKLLAFTLDSFSFNMRNAWPKLSAEHVCAGYLDPSRPTPPKNKNSSDKTNQPCSGNGGH